jgi:hypothetical protein
LLAHRRVALGAAFDMQRQILALARVEVPLLMNSSGFGSARQIAARHSIAVAPNFLGDYH